VEKHIESRVLLLAAEKIRQLGTQQGDDYVLDHVQLQMSFDGYTITLKDRKTAITVFFHNKIKSDYGNMSDLESFYQKLIRISQLDSK
jgi:hypothetical protein